MFYSTGASRDAPLPFRNAKVGLERHHERVNRRRPRPDRCGIGRRGARQYARVLARWRPGEFVLCGGGR